MTSTRCAACKQLRRRCPSDCIFLPYFPPNNPQRFSFVHKIYGASNVGKMLQQVEEHQRADVAHSLYYEAYCRTKNPVYGCVGNISILHQEIYHLEWQLAKVEAEISLLKAQAQTEAQLAQGQQVELSPANMLADKNGVYSSLLSSFDLSTPSLY
ncbi:lob domain-containing protein 24 [Nicotiana attenuata]|uniref:Lob domain-containing protein 24 n=1 Tax=Nicotiana attenuata TaxID=49451 RepID=A0A1J6IQ34_NICAT|nr:lob domain-containing protein 24 [Nicotiana attenuata]